MMHVKNILMQQQFKESNLMHYKRVKHGFFKINSKTNLQKKRFKVLSTEDLILKLLAEGINLNGVKDKKLWPKY